MYLSIFIYIYITGSKCGYMLLHVCVLFFLLFYSAFKGVLISLYIYIKRVWNGFKARLLSLLPDLERDRFEEDSL